MIDKSYLDQRIRKVPNFPKEGILYYDATTLFEDAEAHKKIIDELCGKYKGQKIDKIIGIEARGFLMASTMAYILGTGLSVVRKKGKLPHVVRQSSYKKEYGLDTIEISEGSINPGEKIIIVDDLLGTGGTMLAAIDLVKQMQGEIVGIEFIINLSFLNGEERLKDYPIHYLINYDR